jgi:hypothetical protein
MVFGSQALMNLMLFGYCANLAYVVHVNVFSASCERKLCHFGMVYFGIEAVSKPPVHWFEPFANH